MRWWACLLGRLADSTSRKRLLAGGVLVWPSPTGVGGLGDPLPDAAWSRAWASLWAKLGACRPAPVGSAICFNLRRRSRALAFCSFGVPIGGALSYAIGGPAAQAWGWRAALVLAALPAVLLTPALLSLARAAPQEPAKVSAPHAGLASGRADLVYPAHPDHVVDHRLRRLGEFQSLCAGDVFPGVPGHDITTSRWAGRHCGAGVGYAAGALLGGISAGVLGRPRTSGVVRTGRVLSPAAAALVAAPVALAGIMQRPGAAAASIVLIMGSPTPF